LKKKLAIAKKNSRSGVSKSVRGQHGAERLDENRMLPGLRKGLPEMLRLIPHGIIEFVVPERHVKSNECVRYSSWRSAIVMGERIYRKGGVR
jgi:hypothetical protein